MNPVITQLENQFAELYNNLSRVKIKPEQWFKRSDLFHSSGFKTRSDDIQDYLNELKANINKLASLTDIERTEFMADMVKTQFACLKNLLNSTALNTKAQRYDKDNARRIHLIKQLTKRVSKDSQQLYSELSELKEFERRLEEMVADKQLQLNSYSGQKLRQEYQQQVLLTQQRLGRCRKAISDVEEQIQRLDSKNK